MNEINRYVFRQLLVGMIFVTAALTCVIWLTQSLRFVEMIVNRGLSAGTFLTLTALSLPYFISIILPVALFTVVVFTYNKMINDRELVVMRTAGLSQMALAKPALVMAGLVAGVSYLLNLWLLPASYTHFRDMQWEIRNYSHILLQEGAFNPVADGISVYVRERKNDGRLLGILVHDKRKGDKAVTAMAEQGALIATETGNRVVMFNGNRQQFNRETNQLSILYFDRYVIDLKKSGSAPLRGRGARERTLEELLDSEQDTTVESHQVPRLVSEAHRRMITPVASFGFTLIALSFLISGGFTRRNQPKRIIGAVACFIAVQASMLGAENLANKDNQYLWLLYVTSIAPSVIALWFLIRAKRYRGERAWHGPAAKATEAGG